jgi:hypothetical protein
MEQPVPHFHPKPGVRTHQSGLIDADWWMSAMTDSDQIPQRTQNRAVTTATRSETLPDT